MKDSGHDAPVRFYKILPSVIHPRISWYIAFYAKLIAISIINQTVLHGITETRYFTKSIEHSVDEKR